MLDSPIRRSNSTLPVTHWQVYTRQECSLCETLLMDLAQALGPVAAASVEVIHIDGNEALERKYGQRVPVLLADGEFLCAYQLDRARLAPYL